MNVGDNVVLRGTIKGVTYGEYGFPHYLVTLPNGCETEFPKPYIEDLQQLDEPKPVKVPQVVADWISFVKTNGLKFKNTYGFYEEIAPSDDVYRVMYYIFKESIADKEIRKWVGDNIDTFARAWLDGYEVEEEKKYKITLLNRNDGHLYLVNQNANLGDKYGHFSPVVLLFTKSTNFSEKCYKLTKKDVVANGFGWVFSCEGIEIEEVE